MSQRRTRSQSSSAKAAPVPVAASTATDDSDSSSVVTKGVAGVQYLFGKQLLGRVLTFVLNVLLTRRLAPSIIGVELLCLRKAFIFDYFYFLFDYQLIMNVVSLLTREGFRRACLRVSETDASSKGLSKAAKEDKQRRINNVPWLIVPFGLVFVPIVSYFFSRHYSDKDGSVPSDYVHSVLITGIAMMVELLSEPAYIQAQNLLLYRLRLQVEGLAVILRTFATVFFVLAFDWGLSAFAYGQLLYAIVLLVGYWGFFFVPASPIPASDLLPRLSPNLISSFDGSLFSLSMHYFWQGVQTIILQDGEKLVLTLAGTVPNQGVFAVVNNLGSLVVRFIFQPMEEVSSSVFSKLIGSKISEDGAPAEKEKEKASRIEARKFLSSTLKTVTYVGLYLAAFGPGFSYLSLHLLYGERYSVQTDAPEVLSVYSFLVLLLAVNGITEAFVYAVATKEQLRSVNLRLVFFSLFYVGIAVFSIEYLGTSGLVLANCANILLRILFNGRFIHNYFKVDGGSALVESLPQIRVAAVFGFAFMAIYVSSSRLCCSSLNSSSPALPSFRIPGLGASIFIGCTYHVLIGVVALVLLTAALYLWERQFLRNVRDLLRRKPA